MNSISTLKEHQKTLNSGNFGTQYLTVYSLSWARLWNKNCKHIWKSFQLSLVFCSGIDKTFLKQFRCMIGSNKCVNVFMGDRSVTIKEGTCRYGVRQGKRELHGDGLEWSHQCKFMISTICIHMGNACNMCVIIRVCVHIGVCLPGCVCICRYFQLQSLKSH